MKLNERGRPVNHLVGLWRVVAICFFLGTLPGFVSALVLSNQVHHGARANAERQHTSLLAGCARSNKLRNQVNLATNKQGVVNAAIVEFLRAARAARLKAGSHIDRVAAHRYGVLANQIGQIRFTRLINPDCRTAFPAPK